MILFVPCAAMAGKADVVEATAKRQSDGRYTVSATVRHADEGWKHYADRFEVLSPDGTVLGTRVLAHPHVNEQPFTRQLSGVVVPDGVTELHIRAHDKVHGLGGKVFVIKLPQ
ncbi:MAG: hypothetical protein K0U74_04215 [Alphaproteobacteria bacterium]|nr:hypothetical protein [Alphaproteobacteria bacterium]